MDLHSREIISIKNWNFNFFVADPSSNPQSDFFKMYNNPGSLKDIFFYFIGKTLKIWLTMVPVGFLPWRVVWICYICQPQHILPQTFSERLLTTLSEKKKLNDVTMVIFDHRHCKDTGSLTTRGLRKFREHKISVFKVIDMQIAVSSVSTLPQVIRLKEVYNMYTLKEKQTK